jgi:regulatory factor X
MQQQFFSLSPMAGQETFASIESRPQHMMAHTPTTSSMLAALQQSSFDASSLDPTGSAFGPDPYGSMSYMDATANQDDGLGSGHQSGIFSDFGGSGNAFEVSNFAQDMGLSNAVTPGSESDHDTDPVKTEQSAI